MIFLNRSITAEAVLNEASSLISDVGSNPEYDRAIAELTSGLIGINTEYKDDVLAFLRAMQNTD